MLKRSRLLKIARSLGPDIKKGKKTELDHFGMVFEDGSYQIRINQPCYGSFYSLSDVPGKDYYSDDKYHGKKPVFFITWHHVERDNRVKLTDDLQRRYFHWLFNKSPYAPAFVTKDCRKVLTEPVIIDCNFPPQFVIGAAILVRYRTEFKHRLQIWDKLVRNGMHRDVALLVMNRVEAIDEKVFDLAGDKGHSVIEDLSMEGLRNFLQHTPTLDRRKTVADGNYAYEGLDNIWGKGQRWKLPAPTGKVKRKAAWGPGMMDHPCYTFRSARKFQEEMLKMINMEGLKLA